MTSKDSKREWKQWRHDHRVSFAEYGGGLVVRSPDKDGSFKESLWCKLIGGSVDVTVRRLLNEMSRSHR